MTRRPYQQVLDELDIIAELHDYNPTVIGTPPLSIDIPSSDIDIACTATNLQRFKREVGRRYENKAGFVLQDLDWLEEPAVRTSFFSRGWEVELFCQAIPVEEQWGVRHFLVEQRLLALCPELRDQIVELKLAGLKTEPAFAALLDLDGDPYKAVLELENCADEELAQLLSRCSGNTRCRGR